jgi:DNA recombination protein Rad52
MFSEPQVKALSSKLSAKHVRTRQYGSLTLSYIEGWHAIAEANRIFGYDSWDRQTMAVKCVWEGLKGNRSACSYIARVRVRVRAGDKEICREGCGSGHGVGLTPGEAHESAIKEAETDAMKRALSTFGNPFGLALYDKEQQNVRGRCRKKPQKSVANGQDRAIIWLVLSSEGEYLSAHEDPVDYCKAMRQLLEAISTRDRLRAFWQRNLVTLAMLRRNMPDLKSDKGEHYAEILTSLYKHQMRLIWEDQKVSEQRAAELEVNKSQSPAGTVGGSTAGGGKGDKQDLNGPVGPSQRACASSSKGNGHVDKSTLPISTPRRIRDKDHLRYVAAQPCIICGRTPSHAHHLRFAQPKAFGRKVSDEWTVPLCVSHHRALHSVGNEEDWWKDKGIDPIAHAVRLRWDTRHGDVEYRNKFTVEGNSVVFDGHEGPKEATQQINPRASSEVSQCVPGVPAKFP